MPMADREDAISMLMPMACMPMVVVGTQQGRARCRTHAPALCPAPCPTQALTWMASAPELNGCEWD